jgi:hypothetical protein
MIRRATTLSLLVVIQHPAEPARRRARAASLRLRSADASRPGSTRQPLEARREILRAELMPLLPDSVPYSETIEASPAESIEAVREQGFEGIVAKRGDSAYKPGQRSAVWQKMRVL